MDWTLLAVSALGFVGIYLTLPRERTSLAKLGGLLGALGLAGLFLYLAGMAPIPQDLPPIPFYIFAAIMIAGSVGVICHPKPVYAALYFVLVTLAGAGVFVLLMAEFMAVVLIIVYAGAILVTYLFVIMLASHGGGGPKGTTPEYDRVAAEPFLAVLVSFVLVGAVLQAAYPRPGRDVLPVRAAQADPMMQAYLGQFPALPAATEPASAAVLPTGAVRVPVRIVVVDPPGNIQMLGWTLYGQYLYSLELAGLLLTIAMVGAVMIARKNVEGPASIGSGRVPSE